MASIPLPALGIRPPEQQQGPLEQYGRVLALKSLMGQQQLNQQELQMRQMDLQDRQTFMQAFKDANGDSEKALELATQRGFSNPQTAIAMRKSLIDYKKSLLDLNGEQRTQALQQADLQLQAHDRISQLPEAQRPQAYQNELQALSQSGIDVSKLPQQYPGQEQFDLMGLAAKGGKADLERAQAKAQTAEAQAKTGEAQAKTTQTQMQTQALAATGGFSKEQLEAATQLATAKAVRGEQLSDFEKGLVAANQLSKTEVSSSTNSMTGATTTNVKRPAPIPGVNLPQRGVGIGGGQGGGVPAYKSPQLVDQIGTGQMALNRVDFLLARNPELAQAVAIKYPDFDSSKVKSYLSTREDFTHGKTSDNITAGAVAIQHLAQLKDINDKNPVEVRIPGTKAYQAYHNLLDTVADELGKFYGEPKTNEVIESKKSTLGALVNRDAAITEQAKAMGVRMDEFEQRWANAAPSASYHTPMPGMSQQAKQARAALDPEYAQRLQVEPKPQPNPQPAQPGGKKPFDWNDHPIVK